MGRRRSGEPVHGWIAFDKPLGMTSTQAVAAVRRAANAAKAGHGGTLDPLATGMLPIALGEATKSVAWAMAGVKRYRMTVRWGSATATDDAEGAITEWSDKRPDEAAIRADLIARDTRDRERAEAPLRPAEDAILLDTSGLDADAVFAVARAEVDRRLFTRTQ